MSASDWSCRLGNLIQTIILMTRHYPDRGIASDGLNQISHAARSIRSTTQIWVVTRHQYGISVLVSQTSLGGETCGSVAKYGLFSVWCFLVQIKGLFTWSGGPRSSGVGFFCFHALADTKQKKPTPLDRGPPLHVNRVLGYRSLILSGIDKFK